MKKPIILLLILMTSINIYCQTEIPKTQFVNDKNGLFYRDKPNGQILGKFEYASKIKILGKTKINQSINDKGKTVLGTWVKVKMDNSKVGYVFDGYLTDKHLLKLIILKKPENELLTELKVMKEKNKGMYSNFGYMYLKKYYDINSVKIKIEDPEGLEYSFKQKFSNNINYIGKCEVGYSYETINFPKTDLHKLKQIIELMFKNKNFTWELNKYGIEGNVTCEIIEKPKSTTLEIIHFF